MKSIRKLCLVLSAVVMAVALTVTMAPTQAEAAPASHHGHGYYNSCNGHVHWVASGESLSKIARKYSVTVHALASANGLSADSHIYVHQKLCVPKAMGAPNGCAWYHHVHKGQTLSWIAKYYGVDYSALAAANKLADADHIYYGMKLCIPQIYGTPSKGHVDHGHHHGHHHGGHGYYIVKKGDTLSEIAKAHGVSTHYLAKANGIKNVDHIYYGMKIKVSW